MLFFNRDKKIKEIGLLQDCTDWHCHILPGVDDGIPTMQDTLAVLDFYDEIGMKEVWFTPHIMEEMPNTPSDLRMLFADVISKYKGPMKLHLAAEHMLDPLFDKRLAEGEVMPIGPNSDHLLVETAMYMPKGDLLDTFQRIKDAGYQPVLAHPERYSYMDESDYDQLKALRIKFQLNLMSFAGAYGKQAQETAKMLYRKEYYCVFGSDLHRLEQFKSGIDTKAIPLEMVQSLMRFANRLGPNYARRK